MNRLPKNNFLVVFLVLALVVAGTLAASGQGKMAAERFGRADAITMVLCTGDGPALVSISVSGTPVPHSPAANCDFCPACILNVDALQSGPVFWVHPESRALNLTPETLTGQYKDATVRWRFARGPPIEA